MRSRFFVAVYVLLLLVSPVFAASHEKNFEIFEKSIIDEANKISWSSNYDLQDIEFIEDEMDGDETVYQRAWYDDHYALVRKYDDKTWSESFISAFWTDSDALTFARGVKVGSPFDDVKEFFGNKHLFHNSLSDKYYVYKFEAFESDEHDCILSFSVKNNRITSIAYFIFGTHETSKMDFLFSLYSDLFLAEITGEKVNVREDNGYGLDKGKVKFQVSRSKGDRLLVELEKPENGWCYVRGRIINNSLKAVPYYYISRKFVKTRNLTSSERKLYLSQYLEK